MTAAPIDPATIAAVEAPEVVAAAPPAVALNIGVVSLREPSYIVSQAGVS